MYKVEEESTINLRILKNRDFASLEPLFFIYDWELETNALDKIELFQRGYETEYIQILIDNDNTVNSDKRVSVSFPIQKSIYQYKTFFANTAEAVLYLKEKIQDYKNANENANANENE